MANLLCHPESPFAPHGKSMGPEPSGVGKTTFLAALKQKKPANLEFIKRATSRARRPNEDDFEYDFYSEEVFLQKVFAGDLIFPKVFDKSFYGIDGIPIKEVIKSSHDGIVMSGIFAAMRLKALYADSVDVIYMHSDTAGSLHSPQCLYENYNSNQILISRLERKLQIGHFGAGGHAQDLIKNRMRLNYLNLSFVNGELRRDAYTVNILENIEYKMDETIESFLGHRLRSSDHANSRTPPKASEI